MRRPFDGSREVVRTSEENVLVIRALETRDDLIWFEGDNRNL
jgi:hypothetical protein